jgi:4-hydroxy-tetrahydrodipicolinate synthase
MGELRGLMTAIVTPFDEKGALALDALPGFLDFQREAGIDGVVVTGTNGEGVSLSVNERKAMLEASLRLRGGFTVVAATGAASIADTIELTRHAGKAGADAALVLPPFFFKNVSARGVADFFRPVLDSAEIPVLLYSIPQFSGVEITDAVLALLEGHPRLAGLKDSAGRWERTHALIAGRRGSLSVFPGSDDLLARGLRAGAVGAISGTANAFPELVVGVKRALESGGDAADAQARLDAAKRVLLDYPFIAGNKTVLAYRGVARMSVRPPLVNLTAEQEREMLARLKDAGVLA